MIEFDWWIYYPHKDLLIKNFLPKIMQPSKQARQIEPESETETPSQICWGKSPPCSECKKTFSDREHEECETESEPETPSQLCWNKCDPQCDDCGKTSLDYELEEEYGLYRKFIYVVGEKIFATLKECEEYIEKYDVMDKNILHVKVYQE